MAFSNSCLPFASIVHMYYTSACFCLSMCECACVFDALLPGERTHSADKHTHTHRQTAKPHAFFQSETEVHKRKCRQIQYVWAWHGGSAATVCAQNVTQWQRRQRRWRQQRHRRLQHNQTNFDAGWGSTGPTNIHMYAHTYAHVLVCAHIYNEIQNLHLPDVGCCCYCCFSKCCKFCWCSCSWRFEVVFVVAKNMFHLKQKTTTTLCFCFSCAIASAYTHTEKRSYSTHAHAYMYIHTYVCI